MARRSVRLLAAVLCVFTLLAALTGCGGEKAAQLKTGKKLMKDYLSGLGRGAALLDSHVDVLRPDADKLVPSDYVKGTFRAGGAEYEFTVDTVTGEIYTSERLAELTERLTARIASRLGLRPEACVADCLMELWKPAWHEVRSEWPWERAYLGEVLPVSVTDMDAYAAQVLADADTRVLLFLACRDDELYDGRWTAGDLADWDAVEVQLFGFASDEPLPDPETFPTDYIYASDRTRVTLTPEQVDFRAAAQ